MNPNAPSASRIESVSLELEFDARAHSINEREEGLFQKIEGGRPGIVRPPFEDQVCRAVGNQQRRQDCLQNQRGTSCALDVEAVFAGTHSLRFKGDRPRPEGGAGCMSAADFDRRIDGRQMLPHQTRFLAPRPNPIDRDRSSRDEPSANDERRTCPPPSPREPSI